jgi:hypothetical protein
MPTSTIMMHDELNRIVIAKLIERDTYKTSASFAGLTVIHGEVVAQFGAVQVSRIVEAFLNSGTRYEGDGKRSGEGSSELHGRK